MDPCAAVGGAPALVYSSDRVNVHPLVEANLYTTDAVPQSIQAQLTWTGISPWKIDVLVTPASGTPYTLSQTGTAAVVATDTDDPFSPDWDPFGPGWGLATLDRLVSIAADPRGVPEGVLWVYGAGQSRF